MFATPKALLGAATSLSHNIVDAGRATTDAAMGAARKTMSLALETATLEYDEAGNARVSLDDGQLPEAAPLSPPARARPAFPATPGSALSEADAVSGRLAALLEEREELRQRVDEQKAQLASHHQQASRQREEQHGHQLHEAEQRALEAEVLMQEARAEARRVEQERQRLQEELQRVQV